MVFEKSLKSLIQHCERSELRLHFEWTKSSLKMAKMVKIKQIQMRHFGYFSNNVCKHRRRRTFKYGSVKVSALLLFNLWKVHLISASEEPKMLFFQFTRAISSKANQYHHSLAPSLGPKKDRKKVKTFSPKSSTLVKLSFFSLFPLPHLN